MAKNKKLIIIGVVVGFVIIISGVAAVVILTRNSNSNLENQNPRINGYNQGANQFGNVNGQRLGGGINGKILSISGKDLIVDTNAQQAIVNVSDQTQYFNTVKVDKSNLLIIDNTISIQYSVVNNINVATLITKSELNRNLPQVTRPVNDTGRNRQDFPTGMPGNPNGGNRNPVFFGKVVSLEGNTLTAINSMNNETLTFDISNSQFDQVVTAKLEDLQINQTIRVIGQTVSGSIDAKSITIELVN